MAYENRYMWTDRRWNGTTRGVAGNSHLADSGSGATRPQAGFAVDEETYKLVELTPSIYSETRRHCDSATNPLTISS